MRERVRHVMKVSGGYGSDKGCYCADSMKGCSFADSQLLTATVSVQSLSLFLSPFDLELISKNNSKSQVVVWNEGQELE